MSSDKAIVAARKLLLTAMEDVKEGKEPRHIIRDPKREPLAASGGALRALSRVHGVEAVRQATRKPAVIDPGRQRIN